MKRMKVKRIFITALVILVAYVLQCTVFPVLDIAGIKPNLLLIVTASFGFMRGSKSGMLVGFLSGLLIDIWKDDRILRFDLSCSWFPKWLV